LLEKSMDRLSDSRARRFLAFLLITLPLTVVLTLLLTEIAFRLFDPEFLALPKSDFIRWQHDPEVGWANPPNIDGVYTNGHFRSHVTTDQLGNRQNSRQGTYVEGYANILFAGDSRTVSLEVDDDQTVPALLERGLRARGLRYNVINLGVSGYGTDQAVRKAIAFSERYRPTDIIYMFTDGDTYDNNVLKPIAGNMAKGVYVRDADRDPFAPSHFPVPQEPPGYVGVVLFDRDCHPVIFEDPDPPWARLQESLDEKFGDVYVYRWYKLLQLQLSKLIDRNLEPDPYAEVMRRGFKRDFSNEYADGGSVRIRCRSYFDDQIRFLLGELRARSAGTPRIHVVQFPHNHTLRMMEAGQESQNERLFESLRADGELDTFVNLCRDAEREKVDIRKYQCPGDGHFCSAGNNWVADHLLDELRFGAQTADARGPAGSAS